MILGTSKLKPVDPMKMVSIGVKDIIMHPKFWGRTFTTSDIALLQLHDPAVFSKYVQPICLPEPTYRLKVGTQCWVTGWGQVKQRFSGEQDGMEVGGGARWERGGGGMQSCSFMVLLWKLVAVTSASWCLVC